jgi:hypothetical protein
MTIDRLTGFGMLVVFSVVGLTGGCSRGGPTTHRVSGRVQLAGAEPSILAGHTVEAASIADPTVRAFGVIRDDGHFDLETLHRSSIRSGALEGNYRVRIVLSDDDPIARQKAAKAIPKRYLSHETSGLTMLVPTTSDTTFQLAAP